MLYRDWLLKWLENYVQPSAKQRTYTRYREVVEQHIIPQLGELELSEITPYVLQCYVTEMLKTGNLRTGKGLSSNSVNSIITVIQSTLKTAYTLGIINEYSGDKIKRPRSCEKNVDCFSLSEQKMIEQYILNEENTRLSGVLICLYTGLRIGELLALEWSDIDMSKGELRVNKTCYYGKDNNGVFRRITDTPKTKSSIRTIPIPKQLMSYLGVAKKKSRSTYVVANGSSLVSIRSYQRSFALLLKKLHIQHRGFHSLRHTFATRALECGMDVKTLSEILGHKNPTITLSRYAHSLMEHKKEMMNKLGSLFLKKGEK
ncbi:MAG: site-specific integrase [Ruminococcaceae bacterium]|nr:site-specific integrase [Oscillospiraceae bacterium]